MQTISAILTAANLWRYPSLVSLLQTFEGGFSARNESSVSPLKNVQVNSKFSGDIHHVWPFRTICAAFFRFLQKRQVAGYIIKIWMIIKPFLVNVAKAPWFTNWTAFVKEIEKSFLTFACDSPRYPSKQTQYNLLTKCFEEFKSFFFISW